MNVLVGRSNRPAQLCSPLGRRVGLWFALVTLCACLIGGGVALAQDDALKLHVAKTWGYAWGDEMQGLFTLTASGPPDLARVTFLVDNETLAEADAAPFTAQLNTDAYTLGAHTLGATGLTADGRLLHAPDLRVTFVAGERGMQLALRIGGPILALVIGFAVITAVLSVADSRRRATGGARPTYGRLGGAICPQCKHPFPLRWFGLNAITHRYERCPHCGKWSLVKPASPAALRAAEDAVFGSATDKSTLADAEDTEAALRRALDDSRYIDRLP